MFVDVLKKVQQTAYVAVNETGDSLLLLYIL